VRYELAVMKFEDVMSGAAPDGLLEELFKLLELLRWVHSLF
jgi:hypothetical protein